MFVLYAAYRHQRGIPRTSTTLRSVEVPIPVLAITIKRGFPGRVQPSVVLKVPNPVNVAVVLFSPYAVLSILFTYFSCTSMGY